jgi:NADPH:quinone reductase-like Zn-dependent oxidoreductase
MSGGSSAQMFQAMLLGPLRSKKDGQKLGNLMAKPNQKDLILMKELIEAGKVIPVIDRYYPLRDVADAIRYLEEGNVSNEEF